MFNKKESLNEETKTNKIKEFFEEHKLELMTGGYSIACIAGTVALTKWVMKLTSNAITTGIDNSCLGRR